MPVQPAGGGGAGDRLVLGGQRRPGEEGAGGLRVAQLAGLLQVRVDRLLDGPHLGLHRHVAQRVAEVADHLDGPYHPVAVHEQRGALQPGVLVHLGPGRGVAGEDPGHLGLAAGLDGEGQRVADHAVRARLGLRRADVPGGRDARQAGRHLHRGAGAGGAGRRGLAQDGVAQRAEVVADAAVHRLDHLAVRRAVHPLQEGLLVLPLAGDQPLARVVDRLAQLVADVTGDRGHLVPQLLVHVEEALLGTVLDLQHQHHPQSGVGLGLLLRLGFGQSCHDPLSALGRTLRAVSAVPGGCSPAWEAVRRRSARAVGARPEVDRGRLSGFGARFAGHPGDGAAQAPSGGGWKSGAPGCAGPSRAAPSPVAGPRNPLTGWSN